MSLGRSSSIPPPQTRDHLTVPHTNTPNAMMASHRFGMGEFGSIRRSIAIALGAGIQRLAEHGCGTTLLHARTEAEWFEPIWAHASAILFMADRIKFCRPDGTEQPANSGAPPILASFRRLRYSERLEHSEIPGALVTGWRWMPAFNPTAHC